MKKFALISIALFAVIFLAGCNNSSDGAGDDNSAGFVVQEGYYKASDLEPSVKEQFQENLDSMDNGATAEEVSCVEASKRHWECLIKFSDSDGSPDRMSIAVTVASDYQSWLSHAID